MCEEDEPFSFVFAFGQSYVKSGIGVYENNTLVDLIALDCISMKGERDVLNDAIIKTITDKIDLNKDIPCKQIHISIANYVINGVLYNRGRYAVLKQVAEN